MPPTRGGFRVKIRICQLIDRFKRQAALRATHLFQSFPIIENSGASDMRIQLGFSVAAVPARSTP